NLRRSAPFHRVIRHEENVSTQGAPPEAQARIPAPYADALRPSRPRRPPSQRTEAPRRLSRRHFGHREISGGYCRRADESAGVRRPGSRIRPPPGDAESVSWPEEE